MGMNYYIKIDTNKAIQGALYIDDVVHTAINTFKLHIGKSSWGWTFVFQRQEIYNPMTKSYIVLDSYRSWKDFVTTAPVLIIDEEGFVRDKDTFFIMVLQKQKEAHPNMEEKEILKEFEHYDSDGFRIQIGEFS